MICRLVTSCTYLVAPWNTRHHDIKLFNYETFNEQYHNNINVITQRLDRQQNSRKWPGSKLAMPVALAKSKLKLTRLVISGLLRPS